MKRYDDTIGGFIENNRGKWVKFEDAKAVLNKILEIIEKGTPNRRHPKVWEQKIVDLIEEEKKQ